MHKNGLKRMQKIKIKLSRFLILLKNNNNELVSFTDEKLKVWHSHYKFLGSNCSGHGLSKDYWKDSDALRNLERPRQTRMGY